MPTKPKMVKRYYNAAGLEQTLDALEQRFRLSSEAVHEAHQAGDEELLADIPGFERSVWVDLYGELRRLRGDDFAERAERELELA